MAKLTEYNGRFCESDFENAFISLLENASWTYLAGNDIKRASPREVINVSDLKTFLGNTNKDLTEQEIGQICDNVRLVGSETDFATLHKVYGWMVDGVKFTPQKAQARMVHLIDFEEPSNNIFRVVNQFSVDYVNNGVTKCRRPDIVLFVNGLPICVMELKNPADENATIFDA